MENTLGLAVDILSIIGTIIACFTAASVYKIVKTNNKVSIEKQSMHQEASTGSIGDIITGNNSNTHIENYTNPVIHQVKEKDPPELTEKKYVIQLDNVCMYEYKPYQKKYCHIFCNENNLLIKVNYTEDVPVENFFVGVAVRSLPFTDFRSFVKKGYTLCFDLEAVGQIKNLYIEIKDQKNSLELYKGKIPTDTESFQLSLKQFLNMVDNWKNITEICFVFIPENGEACKGIAEIKNLCLSL